MSEQRKIIPNIHTTVNETIIILNEIGDAIQPLSNAIYGDSAKITPVDGSDHGQLRDRVDDTRPSNGGAFNDLEADVRRMNVKANELVKTVRELTTLILG